MRFRLMLSSMAISAAASTVMKWLLKISETTRASNFKIYHNGVHNLYIFTRNDVIIYLGSTTNRINVFIFGYVWSRFLANVLTDLEEVHSFG